MRTQIVVASAEVTLVRLLDALERELLEASDQEILDAAKELGMDPTMKGSAAFLGLKYSAALRWEDFFGDGALFPELRAWPINKVDRPRKKRKGKKDPSK